MWNKVKRDNIIKNGVLYLDLERTIYKINFNWLLALLKTKNVGAKSNLFENLNFILYPICFEKPPHAADPLRSPNVNFS